MHMKPMGSWRSRQAWGMRGVRERAKHITKHIAVAEQMPVSLPRTSFSAALLSRLRSTAPTVAHVCLCG